MQILFAFYRKGYYSLPKIIKTPNHKSLKETLKFTGSAYDPEKLNIHKMWPETPKSDSTRHSINTVNRLLTVAGGCIVLPYLPFF
jgi:hypothetical protein